MPPSAPGVSCREATRCSGCLNPGREDSLDALTLERRWRELEAVEERSIGLCPRESQGFVEG